MNALDKQNNLAGSIQNVPCHSFSDSRRCCTERSHSTNAVREVGNMYRVTTANTFNKFLQMKSKLKKYEFAMGVFFLIFSFLFFFRSIFFNVFLNQYRKRAPCARDSSACMHCVHSSGCRTLARNLPLFYCYCVKFQRL